MIQALNEAQRALLARIQSDAPTRYLVRRGEEPGVYVFCAYDALLIALLTARPLRLEGRPPAGAPIGLELHPDRPEAHDLWHSFVSPEAALPEAPGMPSRRCPYLHLFARRQDAEAWRATLPAGEAQAVSVIPLAGAWERARRQVEALGRADRP